MLAGPKAIGIIEGIAEATSSLLRLVTGVIFDRTRKAKPWLVFGYGIAGLSRPLIAFISSWPALLFIRFADRVGKGLRSSPRDALLANSTSKKNYGLVFGFHRAMDNSGAIIGPLMAAVLVGIGISLQNIFLLAIVPAILAVSLSLMLKEKKIKKEGIDDPKNIFIGMRFIQAKILAEDLMVLDKSKFAGEIGKIEPKDKVILLRNKTLLEKLGY